MSDEALLRAAAELYGLAPGRFVEARDVMARAARAEGRRDLAREISGLRRPTVAAWALNLLARERADLVLQVVELGEGLREAQSLLQGDALRDLTRQRRRLVGAVTAEVRAVASANGQRLSEPAAHQVEETLLAAMADRAAAAALRSGLLATSLISTGLDSLADALALELEPGRPPPPAVGAGPRLAAVPDPGLSARAEARWSQAESAARAAAAASDKARRRRAKREARVLQLGAEIDELRRRLASLEHARETAEAELAEAEDRQALAESASEEADSEAARAKAALDALHTPHADPA